MNNQALFSSDHDTQPTVATLEQRYEFEETRQLVDLVNDAASLLISGADAAFREFRTPGSRWRHGESYIFVLDPDGNMLLHPDPQLEGKNQLELKDISGRPINRGLIEAAAAPSDGSGGWYHYQWPVPGGMLARWKSSYVRLVRTPSGKSFIVGAGMYNDRMERAFVVDMVTNAVREIERRGQEAFSLFRDRAGSFIAKDAYVFVLGMDGVEIVNPAFPNLEGRNVLDLVDTHGKHLNREMIQLVQTTGSGWVEYMWPKPGESVSTQKSAYVSGAKLGDTPVLVGCGVYLADAPKEARPRSQMTANELMALVRDAAAILATKGETAYPELRTKGSRWLRDDIYLFVWTMDGTRVFHAADPAGEGQNVSGMRDSLGRPVGAMIMEAGASSSGEGWIHYMHPEPGTVFPSWKSTFVKRVIFPSGAPHIVGCGIYRMQMDKAFIEDMVGSAAALITRLGKNAFPRLRDRMGPFVFMDTYVFVDGTDGTEFVNPAQPSLEGMNLMDMRDLKGKAVVRDEIAAAMKDGSAWLECYWFKPGDNKPARKQTYVRKVEAGGDTYIVGSGIYVE